MQLAFLSDIHSNHKALESTVDYLRNRGIDEYYILGDNITDGPYPEKTLAILYRLQNQSLCHFIRGNRENYLLQNEEKSAGWHPGSSNGMLYYTAMHLKPADILFMRSMSEVMKVEKRGYPTITLCHGSQKKDNDNFTLDPDLMKYCMCQLDTPYLIGGHTHYQESIQVEGRWYLNPGSIGEAVDGAGCRARCLILHGDSGRWIPEFVSLSYDVKAYLAEFEESGLNSMGGILPQAVQKLITTGTNYFAGLVFKAMKITGKQPADISEEEWKQAAEEIKL